MTISEKVAYLKGLADGLDIDAENSKEGKLLTHIIGILEEVGMSIEDLEDSIEAMGEEIPTHFRRPQRCGGGHLRGRRRG